MLIFSLLIARALSQTEPVSAEIRMANKIKAGFSCENFAVKFKVTKRQLYKSVTMPKSNEFKIGIGDNCERELTKEGLGVSGTAATPVSDEDWHERRFQGEFSFFTDKGYEDCGSTLIQDEFGIVYELHVKGRRAKSNPPPYTERTLIFSCFYPMAKTPYDDLPLDLKKYIDGEYKLGTASMQFRGYGNLTAEFDLYNVLDPNGNFYPNDPDNIMMKSVGGPIMVGVKPVPEPDSNGDDQNNFTKFPTRWDYFVRDCIWSGEIYDAATNTTTQKDIELIKRNCKTNKYHVQQLSKYALPDSGHVIMFEAIAFEDALSHWLTCDVDVCLKTRNGNHAWPGCHQPCRRRGFVGQRNDEEQFRIPTTVKELSATTPPETSVFSATTDPPQTVIPETFATTQTVQEPLDDLMSAKAVCIDNFFNSHFYDIKDQQLFLLCQYIRSRFPEEFEHTFD